MESFQGPVFYFAICIIIFHHVLGAFDMAAKHWSAGQLETLTPLATALKDSFSFMCASSWIKD